MIENNNLGSIMGAPVVGPNDEKIGTVGVVFIDPVSNQPNWATVHTGLFGRHESFVPLDDAVWDREMLHISYPKETVKGAPRIDTDSELGPEDEAELYRYYDRELPQTERSDEADADADARSDAAVAATPADAPPSRRLRRHSPDDAAAASTQPPSADDGPRHRA